MSLELTLQDLSYLKMHSRSPKRVGEVTMFHIKPNLDVTLFKEFHEIPDVSEVMEHGQMVGVMTKDGLKWKIECEVIL